MADIVTPEERSRVMGRIRSKDTGPERAVRSLLHGWGYRFRLHRKDLPGSPDVTLPRLRTVVFVHGCFWHRHPGCSLASEPKSREEFWNAKFARNVARDERNREALRELGWRVVIVWECGLRRSRMAGTEAMLRAELLEAAREARVAVPAPKILPVATKAPTKAKTGKAKPRTVTYSEEREGGGEATLRAAETGPE